MLHTVQLVALQRLAQAALLVLSLNARRRMVEKYTFTESWHTVNPAIHLLYGLIVISSFYIILDLV